MSSYSDTLSNLFGDTWTVEYRGDDSCDHLDQFETEDEATSFADDLRARRVHCIVCCNGTEVLSS